MDDLNDLFKHLSEVKSKDPKYQKVKQIENEIKESVKTDLNALFSQLSSLKETKVEEPVKLVEEVLVEEVLIEVDLPTAVGKVPDVVQIPDIDKYLNTKKVDAPPVAPLTNEFKQITDKVKFLEQWISKIQNAGPGSGEVNFRYLDDVNRGTMNPANNNWVLEYDSATKKVQFTENVGALKTFLFNVLGSDSPLVPGQLAWNASEDCLDIRHADGSTLQTGLEQHMQVYNGTGALLPNGTVVRFTGVNGNGDETPIVAEHIADGTIQPLYTVGVLTTELPAGGIGRATTYGKVRGIQTTGASVGETWVVGDILYVSPTNPGKFTKVKPTAPNIVVPMAAVLRLGTTDGILLVRPIIYPRLFYGAFSDTTDQTAAAINTPYAVRFNTTEIANGHSISNNSRIVAQNSGLYNYQFSLQIVSNSASKKELYIWARKNGIDIPDTTGRITVTGNDEHRVPSWNYIVSMNANDYFQIMWAVSDTGVFIDSPPATTFCPALPSAILTVTEAAL